MAVTTVRVSPIMNLLLPAPDIQEALLFLDPAQGGRNVVNERGLRRIVASMDWARLLAAVPATQRGRNS